MVIDITCVEFCHPNSDFSSPISETVEPSSPSVDTAPSPPAISPSPPPFNSIGPMYQGMTSDAAYQNPGINSPDQRKFQVPGAHFNQRPLWRPMELATPSNTPQGNPPILGVDRAAPLTILTFLVDHKVILQMTGVDQAEPLTIQRHQTCQEVVSSATLALDRRVLIMAEAEVRSTTVVPITNQGGGNRYPDSGRGSGRSLSNSTSPVSRMSGRRGGSHESVSAEVRPDLYYRKEMVEDPWKMLTPVIWKDTHADKSWLPKFITLKKAKVSTEFPQTLISQPSLAEYLASSFSESTNEPDFWGRIKERR